MEFLESS